LAYLIFKGQNLLILRDYFCTQRDRAGRRSVNCERLKSLLPPYGLHTEGKQNLEVCCPKLGSESIQIDLTVVLEFANSSPSTIERSELNVANWDLDERAKVGNVAD
jgi:hypothetical protein